MGSTLTHRPKELTQHTCPTLIDCLAANRLPLLLFTRHEENLLIQWLEGIWLRDTCSMTAEVGGILDTRNTMGVQIFDGTDANWESWRVDFEAFADLANMGAHLDVAAEQTSFITHVGLDANSVTISRTVHALLTTIEGARDADARLVAPMVDGPPEDLSSSSRQTTPSFETARAPRESLA